MTTRLVLLIRATLKLLVLCLKGQARVAAAVIERQASIDRQHRTVSAPTAINID